MKGLENAIRNLNSLDTRMVPQASAWAINRVAQKAVSVATRQVAGNTVAGDSSDAAVADFSLLPEENGIPERTDEELMHLGEGISGGVRYGPDSQPGH